MAKNIKFDFNLPSYATQLVGDAKLDEAGPAEHHIASMNHLYQYGIPQIVSEGFKIECKFENQRDETDEDKSIDQISFLVRFSNVKIGKPIDHMSESQTNVLYPIKALTTNKTYSSDVYTDISVTATAYFKNSDLPPKVREDTLREQPLFKIPVMIRSALCNTYKMLDEELLQVGEDPKDCGGYFIINGVEWVISCVENILYNQIRIFKNEGFGKEIVRSEFISKPGNLYQNSGEVIIRWNNDNSITVNIFYDPLKKLFVPLFTFFRMLGYNTDQEIVESCVLTDDPYISTRMVEFLRLSLMASYDRFEESGDISQVHGTADNMRLVVDVLKNEEFKKMSFDKDGDVAYQLANSKLAQCIDTNFLPHIGLTKEDRYAKGRQLGLNIYKVFLVRLGIIKPTDRDSLLNKRVAPAGMNYAKPFKSYFNQSVVRAIRTQLKRDFEISSFSEVNLLSCIKTHNYMEKFEQLLMKAIKAGTKAKLHVGHNRDIINRLSSKQQGRKNALRTASTVRQVTTTTADNAKQTNREKVRRLFQASAIGYFCAGHSAAEGTKVGINKVMTLYTTVTLSSPKEILEHELLEEKELFIPLDTIDVPEIVRRHLHNVFVNGTWFGVTPAPLALATKFRNKRRNLQINPYVGVWWDVTQNELYLESDMGRVTRPMLIVYNNKRDSEVMSENSSSSSRHRGEQTFKQFIALTNEHVKGLMTKQLKMEDLLRIGIVEYIPANEQENCYVCPDFETLMQDKNNELHEYTHCDLPAAIFGLTALTCPYASYNQATRVTFQTSQGTQTAGRYVGNWPFRCDNDLFLQNKNEIPLSTTVTNRFIESSGLNVMVAVTCYDGFNQEDSIIMSASAMERGSYGGCKFSTYQAQLESNEIFGIPKADKTLKIKNANYEKLMPEGVVPMNCFIKHGDVLIGKMSKTTDGQFIDQSVVYHENEDAIVHNVIRTTVKGDDASNTMYRVCLRKPRPPTVGDKFSSRLGQKGIYSQGLRDADMPFDENGVRPFMIINSHYMPSRMTVGQEYESSINLINTHNGTRVDATAFKKFDIDDICAELRKIGLNQYGNSRLYCGITGEYIDAMIFMGPVYYQRLLKFVEETIYSIEHGPTDLLTRQPLDGGRKRQGGLRLGEMEVWCLDARGAMRLISEKFREHSDGTTEYICRCGRPAIVHKGNSTSDPIYRCPECGDMAEIYAVPTTVSARLFAQEIESMNFGFSRELEPFQFEKCQKPKE